MEEKMNSILFIEEWLMKDTFPKQARKEFVTLGFLSAHTQLLTSSKEVQNEAVIINKLGIDNYLEGAIGRNVERLDDSLVQTLSQYLKKLSLEFAEQHTITSKKEYSLDERRQIYKNASINIKSGKSNGNNTKRAMISINSLIASIMLGLGIYLLDYKIKFNKIENNDNYIADTLKKLNLGGITTVSQFEQSMKTTMDEASEQKETEFETSDKLIVTSEDGDITTGNIEQSMQTKIDEVSEQRELNEETSDKLIVTSESDNLNVSVKFGEPFQTLEDYEFHEYANMLPLMAKNEQALLKEGILANGQYEPILLYGNKIVDGRNRYTACKELNKPVLAYYWLGNEEDLVSYVFERNINRRDLTGSQRAMSSCKLLGEAQRLAKLRQGERNDLKVSIEEAMNNAFGVNEQGKKNGKHRAADDVATELKTNRTYVNNAAYIYKNAPDLVDLVLKKEMTIIKAYQLAKTLPEREERVEALKRAKGKKGTISAIVKGILAERNGKVDQSVESADIIIITRHDIEISVEYIKQLEEASGAKVIVQTRRKPKEIKS